MNIEELKKIKAKSDGTTLLEHTCAVIETGLNLLQSLPLPKERRSIIKQHFIQAAILHDLGKVHPLFQKRLMGDRNANIRHELVSLWFAAIFLELDNAVLFAIATHHKGVVSESSSKSLEMFDLNGISIDIDKGSYLPKSEDVMCKETLELWLLLFPYSFQYREQPLQGIEASFLYMLREQKQRKKIPDILDRQYYSLLRAFLQAADHLASGNHVEVPNYQMITLEDFQPRNGQKVFPFRYFQERLQSWMGDAVLHAPTGSGKTEAALSWVYANQVKGNRLFYLLPYTASINAMVTRLNDVYKDSKVMVQHSKSLNFIYNELCEEESNLIDDYIYLEQKARDINSLSREVFYPVKVMTLHQLLRITCHGRGWEYSLLECQNALFIIDEFHAYNAFLTGKMLGTVKVFKEMFNSKFLFMSATIPDFLLYRIIDRVYEGDFSKIIRPDPNIVSDASIMGRKRHHLICHSNESISLYINQIETDLSAGKSVLVVVNNVKTCQYIFSAVNFDESRKRMLHGGFNQRSRRYIEQLITHNDRERRPLLLVATQAVEVSLDIDYNVAYIENAPIDALIQRFGRVNRAGKLTDNNGHKIMSDIHLFENIVGKTPFYDTKLLEDTWSVLMSLDSKDISEEDLIKACNEVYRYGYSEKQEKEFVLGFETAYSFKNEWIAGICRDWADEIFDKNNQKIDVLCYNLKEEYIQLKSQKRYIEANELLVSVYPYQKLDVSSEVDVPIATELFYDDNIGCIEMEPESYEII